MSAFEDKVRGVEEIAWLPASVQAAWSVAIEHDKATALVQKLGMPEWKIPAISRSFNFLITGDLAVGKSVDEAICRIDRIISSFG